MRQCTSILVGPHPPPISIWASGNGDCQPYSKKLQGWTGWNFLFGSSQKSEIGAAESTLRKWPIIRPAWWECRTQPRALVKLSGIERIPGICHITISLASAKSWMAKCLILMWQDRSVLSDSNTNVNSMINRRVSLFYRYPLKAFHHRVCPCTLDGVCVVCPGTSELVGQHSVGTRLLIILIADMLFS